MAFGHTLFYAGLLGLVLIALSVRVVLLRRRHRVGVGTGERKDLELAVRAHANFCEYVPLALIMFLALEASSVVSTVVLHGLGTTLLIGRLLHGFFGLNLSPGTSKGRLLGTLLTWLVILLSALLGIYLALGRWLFLAGQ